MAVALKNNPDTSTGSILDRLPVSILVGVLYLVGSLLVLFWALPALWWNVLGFSQESYVASAILVIVGVLLAGMLAYGGARLMGPHPARGLRSGIVVCLLLLLVVAYLARWIGFMLEDWAYTGRLFGASAGSMIALVLGAVLVLLVLALFFRRGFESFLGRLDDQGWFQAQAYKRSQGQRVRRGTILGILLLGLSGVYSMIEHGTLNRGGGNWELSLPFTGEVTIPGDKLGDYPKVPQELEALRAAGHQSPNQELVVNRFALRDKNEQFGQQYMRVTAVGASPFDAGQLVPRSEFDKEREKSAEKGKPVQGEPPTGASGTLHYRAMTLMPAIKFSLPLLLVVLTIWFAWRVVNLPAFADFLIATEAEMNKVSWTTRSRLIQDTIVVLVTVFLLAIFLLAADLGWSSLLKFTGVIKPPPASSKNANLEVPW